MTQQEKKVFNLCGESERERDLRMQRRNITFTII